MTDKAPLNFRWIPIIIEALPSAKIIHIHRTAEAVCWGNFKQKFKAKGLGFSNDLSDIVTYYNLYSALINCWENLYPKRVYHVSYEVLVLNQEKMTRDLINFLGLEWEASCLEPDKNKRLVNTASSTQIRERVYQGSSELWLNFQPYLKGAFGPLKDESPLKGQLS